MFAAESRNPGGTCELRFQAQGQRISLPTHIKLSNPKFGDNFREMDAKRFDVHPPNRSNREW
jgi:hypothetical protein